MKKGFTIIELIVAVTIISIIISVGSLSYVEVIKSSRDARRVSDVARITEALELYRQNPANSSYPGMASGTTGTATVDQITNLAPRYIDNLPRDPGVRATAACTPSGNLEYLYSTDGQHYTVYTMLENNTSGPGNDVKNPPTTGSFTCLPSNTECRRIRITSGVCLNVIFNYWKNNP